MTDTQDHTILLEQKVSIENIAEQASSWEKAMAPESEITIDASATEVVDTAGFQALIAFVNSAVNDASSVKWVGTEGLFVELAELSDVYGALRITETTDTEDLDGLCPVY